MSFMKKTGKALADVIPGLGKFTFDSDLGTVFITSGTGVIGYRVALSLLEAGHKSVRVGIWYGDRQIGGDDKSFAQKCAETLEAKGAEVVDFDWGNEASFENALSGAKTVFCTIPHMDHWSDVFPTFLKKSKEKKVEHFIKVSFLRKGAAAERYRSNVQFAEFHGTCDDILEHAKSDSRISYTILCASHLMSTPLIHQGKMLREDHKFITASYGMGVNYVSPNDIADAAVVVLMDRKTHRNKVYNLSGPGPITDRQVSRLLTEFYGTDIQHIEMGYHDYKKDVKARGLPDWLVRDSAEFEKMKASGVDELSSSYSPDLEKIIGKKPETFKDYLQNKSCMRPGATFP
jgi:NAD(P)H dehydrogenase (quinone)|uniref:NAD(P)-binding domain-containing protein n=1 Tax=Phaeodactylum tricornutum TaxID=2850 RepID=A0A8J9SAC1_PHATR|mmetsp:Transcript_23831/g.57779  ORF Transcript_23831/g.57779 Transcript_23831/m.57779 type:complete len:346 (-) Transcript_23831:335-1372(-)